MFRDVAVMPSGCKISRRHHQMASHGTVYDMAVDPKLEVAITVGQVKLASEWLSFAAGFCIWLLAIMLSYFLTHLKKMLSYCMITCHANQLVSWPDII